MGSKLKARFGRIYKYPALVFIIIQLYFGKYVAWWEWDR